MQLRRHLAQRARATAALVLWGSFATASATQAGFADYLTIEAVPPGPAGQEAAGARWTIYLDGYIDSQASGRLTGLLKQEKIDKAVVYLNSPGGSLLEGMSACPFAFAGGVRRYLDAGSTLGVHRAENRVPVPRDAIRLLTAEEVVRLKLVRK